MQAAWPVLTFYLVVLLALGVGALALATGNPPVWTAVKTGIALLVFGVLGWGLTMILIVGGSSVAQVGSQQSEERLNFYDDSFTTDQAPELDRLDRV